MWHAIGLSMTYVCGVWVVWCLRRMLVAFIAIYIYTYCGALLCLWLSHYYIILLLYGLTIVIKSPNETRAGVQGVWFSVTTLSGLLLFIDINLPAATSNMCYHQLYTKYDM